MAIDAPLIVNNADKQRHVERQLTEIFGPYDAGPYPANLSNPAFQQTRRIQQFVKLLERLGLSKTREFKSKSRNARSWKFSQVRRR